MRLPSRTVPIWVRLTDRLRQAPPDGLHARDERGRHGAHAREKHSELAPAGAMSRPFPVVVICSPPVRRLNDGAKARC